MKVIFLGTSSMIPTKERNTSSIYFSYEDQNILIDCGEGTQRQLKKHHISPAKINKIFITHWHGDHVLGLPGLIQTLGGSEYTKTLEIYGPPNTKRMMEFILKSFKNPVPRIKIKYHEISKNEKFLETKKLEFKAKKIYHSTFCLAYQIKEKDKVKMNLTYLKKFKLKQHPLLGKLQKGKNITYEGKRILAKNATKTTRGRSVTFVIDTGYNSSIATFAKDTDLLITESTYSTELKSHARKYKHLTCSDAAKIAKQANAKKLYLTHFSQRYSKDTHTLVKEAKKIFKNTHAAEDLKEVNI